MANGTYEGKGIEAPEIRALFTRESLIASAWYQERPARQTERDIRALAAPSGSRWRHYRSSASAQRHAPFDFEARSQAARTQLDRVSSPRYLEELIGTIGADPFHLQLPLPHGSKTPPAQKELAPLAGCR